MSSWSLPCARLCNARSRGGLTSMRLLSTLVITTWTRPTYALLSSPCHLCSALEDSLLSTRRAPSSARRPVPNCGATTRKRPLARREPSRSVRESTEVDYPTNVVGTGCSRRNESRDDNIWLSTTPIDTPVIGPPADALRVSGGRQEPAPAPSLLPLLLLNAVTVLWGTQHAVIKLILQGDLSPGLTNFARFGLAALLFSPWTPGLLRHPPSLHFASADGDGVDECDAAKAGAAETWQAGAELGGWMFLGFAFQAVGLGFTTARYLWSGTAR